MTLTLLFCLDLYKDENNDKGLRKFNKSLSMNTEFVTKMKYHIKSTLETLEREDIAYFQARWEFLRYEIRKFSIDFSKLLAQNTKKETIFSENKLQKKIEITTEYKRINKIYEQKTNSIRIRSKCDWYEYGVKSSNLIKVNSVIPKYKR